MNTYLKNFTSLSAEQKRCAIRQKRRQETVSAYNLNPNICANCGKVIPMVEKSPPSFTYKKKFCNHSCAAKYNNTVSPKRQLQGKCAICGIPVRSQQKYCGVCYRSKAPLLRIRPKQSVIHRSQITRHARDVLYASNRPKECCICGYASHVDVCHIVPIREFGQDVSIGIINANSNLVYLCPNCHWEFDHDPCSPIRSRLDAVSLPLAYTPPTITLVALSNKNRICF